MINREQTINFVKSFAGEASAKRLEAVLTELKNNPRATREQLELKGDVAYVETLRRNKKRKTAYETRIQRAKDEIDKRK